MESFTFSMGRPSRQQNRRPLPKKKLKCKDSFCYERKPWRIIPSTICSGLDFWIDLLKGDSYITKRADLYKDIKNLSESTSAFGFPSTYAKQFRTEYILKARKVKKLIDLNQKLRWIFKRFFTRLRVEKFIALNEEDPITLEPIRQPVQIYIFPHRKLYTFEAEAFAKHCHKQLLTNDGQIPTPVFPKNPLTNEHFSLAQTLSLLRQCKALGHTSWVLECFHQCKYDIKELLELHRKPLRINALRATMANVKGWECIDMLFDFIKMQHEEHGVPFQRTLYNWAIHNAVQEPGMISWRRLCFKWYEIDILTDSSQVKQQRFDALRSEIAFLCKYPIELKILQSQSLQ